MVYEGHGFESTSFFFFLGGGGGVVSLSPHLWFLGVGGVFFNFVLFGWCWFYFDFLGDYFFKGNFFCFHICLTFTHSFTHFFLYCGEV